MKKVICTLIMLSLTFTSFSQTEKDYDNLVDKITTHVNAKDAKSIYALFTKTLQQEIKPEIFEKEILAYQAELGKITSTEFWMEGEQGYCYLLEFEKASMVLIIKATPDQKITGFKIDEY